MRNIFVALGGLMVRMANKYWMWAGCCLVCWMSYMADASAADFGRAQFSLLRHDGESVVPEWLAAGAFADALQRDRLALDRSSFAQQTNLMLNNPLGDLKQKIRFAFSPKVVLRPFIIFEELQDLYTVYRSLRANRENTPIDEGFSLKAPLLSPVKKPLKFLSNSMVSISPYYNRVYGLYLQIKW